MQNSSFCQWWNFPLIFCHVKLWKLLYKNVSQIPALMFVFSGKRAFQSNISTKKDTKKDKLLIYPVWNMILKIWDTLFELIQIEVQCTKNYFKISLLQEAVASGNNIKMELQKSHPKLKNIYIKFLYWIFGLPTIQCKW